MGRWYKKAERKQISSAKYERIAKTAQRFGLPYIEVNDMPPAVRLRFEIAIRIFGYRHGDYFYWRHQTNNKCYRFSCYTKEDDTTAISGCWNETVASRDWELIEADSWIHGHIRHTDFRLLPSYHLPTGSAENKLYRVYLKQCFLNLKRRSLSRYEFFEDKIQHLMSSD